MPLHKVFCWGDLVLNHTASKHKKNSITSQTYPETPQRLENWVGFGAQKWDPKNVPKMPPSLMSSTVQLT